MAGGTSRSPRVRAVGSGVSLAACVGSWDWRLSLFLCCWVAKSISPGTLVAPLTPCAIGPAHACMLATQHARRGGIHNSRVFPSPSNTGKRTRQDSSQLVGTIGGPTPMGTQPPVRPRRLGGRAPPRPSRRVTAVQGTEGGDFGIVRAARRPSVRHARRGRHNRLRGRPAEQPWLAKIQNSGRGLPLMHRLTYKMCNFCIHGSFYLIDSTVQRRLLPLTSRLLPSRLPASHPKHATPRPCCGVHDAAVVPPPPSPKQRKSSLSWRLPLLFPPCHLHFGLGAMPSTAESPHRAAAGIEEGEGPIAPPTRGHNGGRKASNAKTEFTAVPDIGGTCLHCHVLVKTTAPRRRGHSRGRLQRRRWGRGQHARRLSTKPRPLLRHDGKIKKGMIFPTAVDALITYYS